jgi:phosphoribosylformylglycinamidine (FGAM) synthase PurS component
VGEVHFGRTITLEIDDGRLLDGAEGATPVADGRIREMCERLLANPVIEDYSIEALP